VCLQELAAAKQAAQAAQQQLSEVAAERNGYKVLLEDSMDVVRQEHRMLQQAGQVITYERYLHQQQAVKLEQLAAELQVSGLGARVYWLGLGYGQCAQHTVGMGRYGCSMCRQHFKALGTNDNRPSMTCTAAAPS
jgi:hypothetical protein